jgi:hypothetical protein
VRGRTQKITLWSVEDSAEGAPDPEAAFQSVSRGDAEG